MFESKTIYCRADNFILSEVITPSLLIYSRKAMNIFPLKKSVHITCAYDNTLPIEMYREIIISKDIKSIISYGGGRTIDLCKMLSYKFNIIHYCIPSMLSTNSFATDKLPAFDAERKTIQSKCPDLIVVDQDILEQSYSQCLLGLSDVFSIHTALFDWSLAELAGFEGINIETYNEAEFLLNDCIDYILNNEHFELSRLYHYIFQSGYITYKFRSGRPESGSEHIFAKLLENKVRIPHGIAVFVGFVLMSSLQNNESFDIFRCFGKIGTIKKALEFCPEEVIRQTLSEIHARSDRYTIINQKKIDIDAMISNYNRVVTEFQ